MCLVLGAWVYAFGGSSSASYRTRSANSERECSSIFSHSGRCDSSICLGLSDPAIPSFFPTPLCERSDMLQGLSSHPISRVQASLSSPQPLCFCLSCDRLHDVNCQPCHQLTCCHPPGALVMSSLPFLCLSCVGPTWCVPCKQCGSLLGKHVV